MATLTFTEQVERLNSLSKTNALIPDEYLPWDAVMESHEQFMPEFLFSLNESELLNELSPKQITRLKQLEVGQVLATYAWSETIGCLMFNEFLVKTTATSAVGKYMVNFMQEEYRHQYMFTRLIETMNVEPQPFSRLHRTLSWVFLRTFRKSSKFVTVLAIEQVSDVYGKMYRKDPKVYSLFRKACELHHIEEGRHMQFQKLFIDEHFKNIGYWRRSKMGLFYLLTIWFMRSQYIRKEFFVEVGAKDPDRFYKEAVKRYRKLFAKHCLKECIDYAREMGMITRLNKPMWNLILKAGI